METPILIEELGDTPDAIGNACQLFEAVFQHPANPHWWDWKYHQAPYSSAINLVARMPASGQLAGHVGAVILPGRHAGQAMRMAHLTDVMVRPEARGGLQADGTYGRLMAAMSEHLQSTGAQTPLFAYGFPGQTPSRLGTRMRLYRPLYPCQEYSWADTPGSWLSRMYRFRPCTEAPWPIAQLDRIWDANAPLAQAPTITKDGAYLQWRYANHPQKPYTLWLVGPAMGAAIGWVVTRQQPKPLVVDALLPQAWRRQPHWQRLQHALIRASGIEQWSSWLSPGWEGAKSAATMIVAVEFDAAGLHPHWPAPEFQPGDTDVF
jgi:hypothetical protein